MNKTAAYIGIIIIAAAGLGGTVVLSAMGVDTGEFIGLFTTTLATSITAAVTLYGLQQVREQNDKISRSVNGNTHKLLSLIQRDSLTPAEAEEVAHIENDARNMMENVKGEHVA